MQRRLRFVIVATLFSLWGTVHAATRQIEPLPAVDPVLPLVDFTDDSGWLERWRQNHEVRAADGAGIVTDRPSFTYSSATVPKGWVQVESGYLFSTKSGYFERTMHTAPEVAVRLGLTPWLGWPAMCERISSRGPWLPCPWKLPIPVLSISSSEEHGTVLSYHFLPSEGSDEAV